MAKPESGQVLGTKLCEIFGLDATKVLKISVTCGIDGLATATVIRHVETDEADELVTELSTYELKPKD